jgi:hypothetical protein
LARSSARRPLSSFLHIIRGANGGPDINDHRLDRSMIDVFNSWKAITDLSHAAVERDQIPSAVDSLSM